MRMQAEAFYLSTASPLGGQRFCLLYPAQEGGNCNAVRGLVLYIHPFAEEMNKVRRMAALQARALASAGFDVLQIDLHGCGDSSDDFCDATWKSWVNDVVQGCRWLRRYSDVKNVNAHNAPLWLWGVRAGCLLAVEGANQCDEACNFLFWQPPPSGKLLLQQFLRLKVAGYMLGGQAKTAMAGIRQQLAHGLSVEIAGYRLSPELAMEFEQATLMPPAFKSQTQRLEWFELSTREDASLSPVTLDTVTQWQQSGFEVASHLVRGPAFWQTSEIEEAPALIAASTAALLASARSPLLEMTAA